MHKGQGDVNISDALMKRTIFSWKCAQILDFSTWLQTRTEIQNKTSPEVFCLPLQVSNYLLACPEDLGPFQRIENEHGHPKGSFFSVQYLFKVVILLLRHWKHLGRASSLKTHE